MYSGPHGSQVRSYMYQWKDLLRYKQWGEQLGNVFKEVKEGRLSVRAAELYNVPKSTLSDRVFWQS